MAKSQYLESQTQLLIDKVLSLQDNETTINGNFNRKNDIEVYKCIVQDKEKQISVHEQMLKLKD